MILFALSNNFQYFSKKRLIFHTINRYVPKTRNNTKLQSLRRQTSPSLRISASIPVRPPQNPQIICAFDERTRRKTFPELTFPSFPASSKWIFNDFIFIYYFLSILSDLPRALRFFLASRVEANRPVRFFATQFSVSTIPFSLCSTARLSWKSRGFPEALFMAF